MKKNDSTRKNKFLAILMALMMSSSVVALAACNDPSDTGDDDDTPTTETKVDDGLIKNADFDQNYEDDDNVKENLKLIGTSVTSWTRSTDSSASGSADSSKSLSGIINTDDDSWEELTTSYLSPNADYADMTDTELDAVFSGMTEAQVGEAWKNWTAKDKLYYYKWWKADDDNDDRKIADLDFYQNFNIDHEDLPTIANPRAHDYDATADQAALKDYEGKVLMLHNNYYTTSYKNRGTAQKYTSSSTVTVKAGTSTEVSVWVKTMDLTSAKTNGAEGGQPAVDKGAYIRFTHSVGSNSLTPWEVKNINTDGVTANNGWLKYTFYLQGSSFADTTFTMVLGLGQGGGDDMLDYVNGYAFFDDIECKTITNAAYKEATKNIGETFDLTSTNKTLVANNKTNETFAMNFYGTVFSPDTTVIAGNNIQGGYVTQNNSIGQKFTSVDTSTIDTSVYGEMTSLSHLKLDGTYDRMQTFTDISVMDNASNPYLQSVYNSYLKNSSLFTNENVFTGTNPDKSVLMLLSSGGASINAKSSKTFTLQDGEYTAISFFVKTSDLKGVTTAQVTLINGNDKTSISGIDTTSITTVDIDDKTKDIYDGWQQCFFFVKNETGAASTFSLEFNLGPTTLLDKSKTDFKRGFAAFTAFKTHSMTEAEYACAAGGTYAKVVSLTDANEEKERSDKFDEVKVTSSPTKNIETNFADPKNYTGVYGSTAPVGGTNAIPTEENENAGLLNQKYAENYTAILDKLGATGTTASEKWASVFGSASGLVTELANQPLVIYTDNSVTAQSYSYGYVGSSTSVSSNSYAAVSLRVKVSAGASAYVYLIDTDEGSFTKSLSVNATTTYWYNADGDVCVSDPTDDKFDDKDVALLRQDNGLFKVNPVWNATLSTPLDENVYYANLLAYTDTVKDKTDTSKVHLKVANGGVSYNYTDDFQHEGNDGIAFYNYNEADSYAYADKAEQIKVYDFSTITSLPVRTQAEADKELVQVVSGGTSGSGWVNVTFYIHTGATAKNYRLEVWSGTRDNSVKNAANSYVIFDTNGNNSIEEAAFTSLLEDRKDDLDDNNLSDNYFETVFSFFDSAKFLRYNKDLDTNEVGNSYDDYNSNNADYAQKIAYLWYEEDGNQEMYVDYSVADKTVTPDVDDTEEDDDSDDTTTATGDETNPLLLASSIAIAAVLVLAVASLAVRKIVSNVRKKRGYAAFNKTDKKK